jgi:hypothetical protein
MHIQTERNRPGKKSPVYCPCKVTRNRYCAGKGKKHHRLPIEKKESYKWAKSYLIACEAQKTSPETHVISAGDREVLYIKKKKRK